MSRPKRLFIFVLGLYGLLCLGAMLFEEKLIFFPTRFPQGDWGAPVRLGLEVEDVELVTEDGVRIHSWLCAPPAEDAPYVLFSHGNAGNISDRADFMGAIASLGIGVLAFDYRGYGKSEGKPTEPGLYLDGEAAFDHLLRLGVDPARIFLFGHSLGGGVATELAVRHPDVGGLILESAFSSLASVGKRHYPYLPVRLLLKSRFDNLLKIGQIRVPLLIIHGDRDGVVPIEEGRALFDAVSAETESESYWIEGAQHNDPWIVGGRAYLEKVRSFVERER